MENEFRRHLEAWYYSHTEKNYDGTANRIKYTTNAPYPVSEAFARRYKSLIFDRAPYHPLNAFRFW